MAHRVLLGVVEAVADVEDVDATELDLVLEDWIDTDALERLAAHEGSSWSLSFEFADHRLTVEGDGWILIDGERQRRWDTPIDGNGRVPVK